MFKNLQMQNKELQAETKDDSEQMPIVIPSSPNAAKPNVSSRIIGRYQITYKNGMVQEKDLISHSDYKNIIIPYSDEIYDFKKVKMDDEADLLKKELKVMFGSEWFTDESLLFEASKTGILSLPKSQGGSQFCKVECV